MNLPLRALMADDERPARKWLGELLRAHPEIRVIGEAASISAAAEHAERERPDVIFLDVQMPPGNGFDLLPRLSFAPRIVFVTAHDAFAVKAFEANALDYLLKPVHPDRLAETVRRLLQVTPSTPSPRAATRLQMEDWIPLRDKGALHMAQVKEIAVIQAEAAYSHVWLRRQSPRLLLQRLKEWEELLPSPPFARIDRSWLIRLDLVREINVRTRDQTCVVLDGLPEPLHIGRAASVRLRKQLKHWNLSKRNGG